MTSTTATDTLTANKRLAVRFLDLISDGDIAALAALISPTWTMEGGPPDLPAGREGLRVLFDHIGGVRQRWTIDDVIAEGDKVVVRATNHCEQDSFFGVPGRGIVQVFTATFTMQIVDGLIAKVWRNAADLQRLFQLGARILPPAPPCRSGHSAAPPTMRPDPASGRIGVSTDRSDQVVLPAPHRCGHLVMGRGMGTADSNDGQRAPMRLERRRRTLHGSPPDPRSFDDHRHPRPDHRPGRGPPGTALPARPRRAA